MKNISEQACTLGCQESGSSCCKKGFIFIPEEEYDAIIVHLINIQAIIRGKVDLESVIHSDRWKAYDGLVDLVYKKHHRVNHSQNEFASEKSHINRYR